MRLDHLLSKEEEVRVLYTVESLIVRSVSAPRKQSFLGRGCAAYTSANDRMLMEASFQHIPPFPDVHLLKIREISGADALKGHTRSHPEHDG